MVATSCGVGSLSIENITYDDLNRLTTALATGGSNGTYAQETYQYDFAGDITSKAGVSCAYNDGVHKHAVTRPGGASYALFYDSPNRLAKYPLRQRPRLSLMAASTASSR